MNVPMRGADAFARRWHGAPAGTSVLDLADLQRIGGGSMMEGNRFVVDVEDDVAPRVDDRGLDS